MNKNYEYVTCERINNDVYEVKHRGANKELIRILPDELVGTLLKVRFVGDDPFVYIDDIADVSSDYESYANNEDYHFICPDNITRIGQECFKSVGLKVSRIILPDTVVELGEAAFKDLGFLHYVKGGNIMKIGEECFKGCDFLSQATFLQPGNNVKFIGEEAFMNCVSLDYVDISNVKRIGNKAFAACTYLVPTLCNQAVEVGEGAFSECEFMDVREIFPGQDEGFYEYITRENAVFDDESYEISYDDFSSRYEDNGVSFECDDIPDLLDIEF